MGYVVWHLGTMHIIDQQRTVGSGVASKRKVYEICVFDKVWKRRFSDGSYLSN